MEYLKPSEIAKKWQVSVTIVRRYCTEGRIEGAEFNGETWLIPENAVKPERKPREEKPPQQKPQPPLVKKLRQQKTKKMYHGLYEIFLAVWIQSHDSFENEPPFEYPLNPLFSNRYRYSENPADCFSELWKNNQLGILLISIEIGL